MTQLPEPLIRCSVPEAFSPSQLGFADQCLLRAVLGSTREAATLTAHPAAALGSVFHKLLELAVRGEIPSSGRESEDSARALQDLLDAEDARLADLWPGIAPRLRDVLPPLTWRRKRRAVLDLAEKYLSGAVPKAVAGGPSRRNAKDLPLNGSWAEIQLEAPALRLKGRADLIEREAGNVTIRDLKTGRVLTAEGDVLPHIERQMQLYGAMAHEVWPTAQVQLVIDYGFEQAIAFTSDDEVGVRAWLREVFERLPATGSVDAELIATPGESCEGCSYRHVCSAYRQAVPTYWRAESRVRMPLDTWGSVVAITRRNDDLADITIQDASGRTVKVFGLASVRLGEIQSGDMIWLFGLRTRDKRGGPETWRHPHNFYEVADDDPFARAWTVQAFGAT